MHRMLQLPISLQSFSRNRAAGVRFRYRAALSLSSRRLFAQQRNREASPLSRRRVDDAVLHRAFRPRPLPLRNGFHLFRRLRFPASAAANARRLSERSAPAGNRIATYRAVRSRARSGVSRAAESPRYCRSSRSWSRQQRLGTIPPDRARMLRKRYQPFRFPRDSGKAWAGNDEFRMTNGELNPNDKL